MAFNRVNISDNFGVIGNVRVTIISLIKALCIYYLIKYGIRAEK